MFQEHLALVDVVGVVKKNILIINDLIMKVRIKNPIWGVPITFLYKYCPTQFEILGIANNVRWIGDFPCLTIIKGEKVYNRILIRKKKYES